MVRRNTLITITPFLSFLIIYTTTSWFLPVGTTAKAATSDPGQPVFFSATGHTLGYNFRVYWEQHGGLTIFGYPLSEVLIEDGMAVQYFERTRMEWHATQASVMLGQFGREAVQHHPASIAFNPVNRGISSGQQDYFVETRHTLSNGFQRFWHNNGGLAIFGFPLSEEFSEINPQDGKTYTVQYFERARFEYHPNEPVAYQVELGQLGRQYLTTHPIASEYLAPVTDISAAWKGLKPSNVRISRINLDTDITEEGSFSLQGWEVPRYTAAHYWPISAFPGTPGNIVIAGHAGYKNSLFNNLPQAIVGDEITVTIGQSQSRTQQIRHYRIFQIIVVKPDDFWIMQPTENEILTLITCVPLNVFDHRLIVRANPVN